ncbi:hypothetical protein D3C83_07830 [compost metagenome]
MAAVRVVPEDGGPAHEYQHQQRARDVQADVDEVIADGVETAGGIVQREREAGEGTSGDRRVGSGDEHVAQAREIADPGVLHDRGLIVEHERAGQAVGVGQRDGGGDDHRRERARHRRTRRRHGHRRRPGGALVPPSRHGPTLPQLVRPGREAPR